MVDATYCFDGLPANFADEGVQALLDNSSMDVVRCAIDALGYLGAAQWRFKIKDITTSGSYNWDKLSYNALGAFMRIAAKERNAADAHRALWWIDDLKNHNGGELIKSNWGQVFNVMLPEFTPILADTLMNEWAVSKDEILREMAAMALGWLRLRRSVPTLQSMLNDEGESVSVRRQCAASLAEVDSPEAADALRGSFQNLSEPGSTGSLQSSVRLHLSQILWRVKDLEFVKTAKNILLSDSWGETRAHTLYSLGLLNTAETDIVSALSSPHYIERAGAALGLARLSGSDSLKKLREAHRESSDSIEQLLVLSALITAGQADKADELHRSLCELSYSVNLRGLRLPWKREILLALDSKLAELHSSAQVWSLEMRLGLDSCYEISAHLVKDLGQESSLTREHTLNSNIERSEDSKTAIQTPSCPVRDHAVVLIHGIRTQAEWQHRVAKALEDLDKTIRVIPTRYEFFDVLRFILPSPSLRNVL